MPGDRHSLERSESPEEIALEELCHIPHLALQGCGEEPDQRQIQDNFEYLEPAALLVPSRYPYLQASQRQQRWGQHGRKKEEDWEKRVFYEAPFEDTGCCVENTCPQGERLTL